MATQHAVVTSQAVILVATDATMAARVAQDFAAIGPDQKWAADINYI